jgi:DNA-binding winged helix-turn-helix (wHTH) protein
MKDSMPERIERKMSQRDGVSLMKGTPVFARCRFSNVMQLPCHIGVQSAAQASLGFGRFRVLLRQRQLLADELPVELGTRAFDLLLALLESDGSLVTKEELLARVWPGIAVAEVNVKVHVSALRKALGEDRDFIRTEFGRGYRFTAAVQLDQDRREGCKPRPLHRLADGRGRHPTADVPGDSAADYRAASKPLPRAHVRRR